MIDDIVNKLNKLLQKENLFDGEEDIVYYFVELRKLLERSSTCKKFRIIKFYSDWVVHTKKDRVKGIRDILEEIKENKLKDVEFAIAERLKEELHEFSLENGIGNVTSDKFLWNKLLLGLIRVLAEQPIEIRGSLKPGDVKSFCYSEIDTKYRLIIWRLEYIDVYGKPITIPCASGKIIKETLGLIDL